MVERLVTALTTLGAVGIRCKRGTLNDKAILPDSPVSYWLDFAGSLIVALYLIYCGAQTILETQK